MSLKIKKQFLFIFFIISIYTLLTIVCWNHCYFWDNIQQISKEAHWFYQNNFSSLIIPIQNSGNETIATGYHPPLMGIMTAVLWKIFGYHLWVSHFFVFCWFFILLYQTIKLLQLIFPQKYASGALIIVLLEATVLTQFAIASPDFILLTAFVICLRAILEQKKFLLSVGLIFLCGINARGLLTGIALFFTNYYYLYLQSEKKHTFECLKKSFIPFLPTLLLLIAYYYLYFKINGWFFADSSEAGHYSLPANFSMIIKHFFEFIIRLIENGRIVVWGVAFYLFILIIRGKIQTSIKDNVLIFCFLFLMAEYLVLVFTTRMPFSGRYFIPLFFVLTLITLSGIIHFFDHRKIKITFVVILLFELTGHFWIYPEKIAQSWDSTLAHLPYYELRKKCFDYIDQQKINYEKISAGFCLYGDRGYIELQHAGKKVNDQFNNEYFIYSNISNIADEWLFQLKDTTQWKPIQTFQKWPVKIILFQKTFSNPLYE